MADLFFIAGLKIENGNDRRISDSEKKTRDSGNTRRK
jgi:hypothetical protein